MKAAPRIPSWITDPVWRDRLSRWASVTIDAFHRYAGWLVSLSWARVAVYSLVLLIGTHYLTGMWPFTLRVTESVRHDLPMPEFPEAPEMPEPSDAPDAVEVPEAPEPPASGAGDAVEISIGKHGVRIGAKGKQQEVSQVNISPEGVRIVAAPAPGASGVASAPSTVLDIRLPPEAAEAIRRDLERNAQQMAGDAKRAAAEALKAKREYDREMARWKIDRERMMSEWRKATNETRTRTLRWGDFLADIAVLWVAFSIAVKALYKGRKEAEAKAAAAEENAEAEALKRQLVEARLQTMQAQVEPHFLFNTLASIDHLIETDPKRASQMQKNLIALLRATMPTMREANGQQKVRDLAREVAVVRPYLEILSVRMEERLQWRVDVPDGLLSAEFPPMIIQGLVENAIKHGLEPKPEGGSLVVSAHIEHGDLVVQVADTGLGFGRAGTSGTGVGLANTRERLQLLYGNKASLTVTENTPSGTIVRIQVPYRTNHNGTSNPNPTQGA